MSATSKAGEDDRLAILGRGRKGRAVKQANAHIDVPEEIGLAGVPAPYDGSAAETLDDAERADLATCETAVHKAQRNARTAYAMVGKALATINQARLYRETHETFNDYVIERWDMSKSQAYRFMSEWPVVELVSPIGDTNEAQVRELLPVLERHGPDATKAYFAALIEQGGRVTAAEIKQTRAALPPQLNAPEEAGDAVRRFRTRKRQQAPAAPVSNPGPPEEGQQHDDGQVLQHDGHTVLQGTVVDGQVTVNDTAADDTEHQAVADHADALKLNDLIESAAKTAERALAFVGEARELIEKGVKPLDQGAATSDKSRYQRAGNQLKDSDLKL